MVISVSTFVSGTTPSTNHLTPSGFLAATAGRFAEHDLVAIVEHQATGADPAELVTVDETHSAQPGTSSWANFTTPTRSTNR